MGGQGGDRLMLLRWHVIGSVDHQIEGEIVEQKDREGLAELIERADLVILVHAGHKSALGPDIQRELVRLLRAKEPEDA